jgi:hypothetical protein
VLSAFLEKSSFVEKMENLPGESNKVRINADVRELNGKSAKNIARKSGKHKRSKKSAKLDPVRLSRLLSLSKRGHFIQCYSLSSLKKEDGEAV